MSPSDIETLKSAILELEGKIKDLNQSQSVFVTFKQTLAASLQAPFHEIVKEQCDSDNYIDLEGKRVRGSTRGRVLLAFKATAIACLRLYAGEEDVYEVTLRLIQNLILMSADKITVEAGVQRFNNLNELLLWCPSRKHLPDAPEALPASCELTEFELCTTVLASHILS